MDQNQTNRKINVVLYLWTFPHYLFGFKLEFSAIDKKTKE